MGFVLCIAHPTTYFIFSFAFFLFVVDTLHVAFWQAVAFNADLSLWNTAAVTNMAASKFHVFPLLIDPAFSPHFFFFHFFIFHFTFDHQPYSIWARPFIQHEYFTLGY